MTGRPPLFFFGAMSPYSWFAAERIVALIPEAEWRPVFAGGLLKASGRESWGLDERRRGGIADCEARARAYGLGSIVWPDPWPTNDLLAARAMVAAARKDLLQSFALAAMRAAFRDGADLAEPGVIRHAGACVGIDSFEFEAQVSDPEIKASVRTATDEAVALGVFGVPTTIVDGEPYWGDDRLDAAASAARSRQAG